MKGMDSRNYLFTKNVFILFILLPLAYAVLAGWQNIRADERKNSVDALNARISFVQGFERPNAIVFLNKEEPFIAGEEIARLEKIKGVLVGKYEWQPQASVIVARVSLGLSLATLCYCFGVLLYMQRIAKRLENFFKKLSKIRWFSSITSILHHFSVVSLITFEVLARFPFRREENIQFFVLLAALAGIPFLLYSLDKYLPLVWRMGRGMVKEPPLHLMGSVVTQEEAPQLWAFVEEIAQKIGIQVPDALVIGLDPQFFATRQPIKLFNEEDLASGLTLHLPLVSLAYLNREEVTVLLMHELRYALLLETDKKDKEVPRYGMPEIELKMPEEPDMNGVMATMVMAPLTIVVEQYYALFAKRLSGWLQSLQTRADRDTAEALGSMPFAVALLRLSLLAPVIHNGINDTYLFGSRKLDSLFDYVDREIKEKGLKGAGITDSEVTELDSEHMAEFEYFKNLYAKARKRLYSLTIEVSEDAFVNATRNNKSTFLNDIGLQKSVNIPSHMVQDQATSAERPMILEQAFVSEQAFIQNEGARQQAIEQGEGALNADNLKKGRELGLGILQKLDDDVAQSDNAEIEVTVAELKLMAQKGMETEKVYSAAGRDAKRGFLSAIVLLAIGIFLLQSEKTQNFAWLWIGLILFASVVGIMTLLNLKKGKELIIELGRDKIFFTASDMAVGWRDIKDFDFSVVKLQGQVLSVNVIFTLADAFPPLAKKAKRKSVLKYNKEKHQLVLVLFSVAEPHSHESVCNLVLEYWHGAQARHELERMGRSYF